MIKGVSIMAIVAGRRLMPPIERKIRICVMIKANLAPLRIAVTGTAFCTEPVVMHVLDPVTADASQRQVRVDLARMTLITGEFFVCIFQRKVGCGMVKGCDLGPSSRRMAVAAGVAQVTIVQIILFVTIDAFRFCFAKFFSVHVAALAVGFGVIADQPKIRRGVIEGVRVQKDNIEIPAFVVGVTVITLERLHHARTAMEARLFIDVGSNFLVTIETKFYLSTFAKIIVTIAALFFQLCMW